MPGHRSDAAPQAGRMPPKRFTLYWSSLENYESCPRKFLWSRGWHTIDLGAGLGRRKPLPDPPPSRHHALMGQVIQEVVEALYNRELWREPVGLEERLVRGVHESFQRQLADPRNFIDWRDAPERSDMLRVCEQGVVGYLRTMRAHRLLGPWARAELDLVIGLVDPVMGVEWPVGGKADVVFRRADTGVTFLDGKNSLSKGRYTDPDQLRWYALLFFLVHGMLPDRLAFVYYRFPHGQVVADSKGNPERDEDGKLTGRLETGIDWVEFTKADLDGLAERALIARRAMEREEFDPVPEPAKCKFCDFEAVCPERQAQKAANRRAPRDPVPLDATLGSDGLLHFGMGGG